MGKGLIAAVVVVVVAGLVVGCAAGGGDAQTYTVECDANGLARLDQPGRSVASLAGTTAVGELAKPVNGISARSIEVNFADDVVVAVCNAGNLGAVTRAVISVPPEP